jgi:hypothetical protein
MLVMKTGCSSATPRPFAATVSAGSTMGHKEKSFSNDGSFDSGHDGTHWQQQHPFDPIVEVRLFEPIKNIVSISL